MSMNTAFDYRGEFERLRSAVEQAVESHFESRAANGVLESAVNLYSEILPNVNTGQKQGRQNHEDR